VLEVLADRQVLSNVIAPAVGGTATVREIPLVRPGSFSLQASWEGHTASVPLVVQEDWDLVGWSGAAAATDIGVRIRARGGRAPIDSVAATHEFVQAALLEGPGEVVLFASGVAPTILENVGWSPGADTVIVPVRDVVKVPVTVWAVSQPLAQLRSRADDAIRLVNATWAAERVGLQIDDVEFVDAYEVYLELDLSTTDRPLPSWRRS
jgi:hypothetical protein